MTQQEKWLEMQRQKEEEKKKAEKPNVSQANQLENIAEAFEKKRQRRMAARNKMTEEEMRIQEEKAVRQAMYEEIIWALKQKKEIAEQEGRLEEVERYKILMKEEEEKMASMDPEELAEYKATQAAKNLRGVANVAKDLKGEKKRRTRR